MALVNKAYAILSNPQKRQWYNQKLLDALKLNYGMPKPDIEEYFEKKRSSNVSKMPRPPKFGTPEYEKWFEEQIEKYVEKDYRAPQSKVIEPWHEILFIGATFLLFCLLTPLFNDSYTEIFFTFPAFMIYLVFVGCCHLVVMLINKRFS